MAKRTQPEREDCPLPQNLGEALVLLTAHVAPEVLAELRATPIDDLISHHRDLGMQVRTILGLWGENPGLLASLPAHVRWPDDASHYILEEWWLALQAEETR